MQLAMTVNDLRAVQAVALASSNDSTRPILTGVRFTNASEMADNGSGAPFTVIGCDSYRLAWHGLTGATDEATGENEFEPVLLPAKQLVAAIKSFKIPAKVSAVAVVAILRVDGDSWRLEGVGHCRGNIAGGNTLEGIYPEMTHLVAGEFPTEVKQLDNGITALNPAYLATLGEVAKVLKVDATPVTLQLLDCSRPARFNISHNGGRFNYLLMPVRF